MNQDSQLVAEALDLARHHVRRAQHDGRHEQDRHDAREWLAKYDAGPCECARCMADERKFSEAAAKNGGA